MSNSPDRINWLAEKRRIAAHRANTLHAPTYDENWGHINPSHHTMIRKFLSLCPPGGKLLDAACGTGKYWSLILENGFKIVGTDQASEMIAKAHAKHPEVEYHLLGLQDLTYNNEFDGVLCVDAMENVGPEEWPLVLGNLRNALKSDCYLYFTVEVADWDETAAAFKAGQEMGFPVMFGEWAHEGGYHYYPEMDQVRTWAAEAGLEIVEEMEGDDYHHFITRKIPVPAVCNW